MKKFSTYTDDQLHFVIADAKEAARFGEELGNPKVSQYLDEVCYASMELHKRQTKG
jgi:hypothetical protein